MPAPCIASFGAANRTELPLPAARGMAQKQMRPRSCAPGPLASRSHRRATLPPGNPAVPSPMRGLTSVFGMGTGVAPAPWTVGKLLVFDHRTAFRAKRCSAPSLPAPVARAQMVKPHGRLVPVSSTHCCASTSGLSTSSSRTALQGTEVPGRSRLGAGFPLRCFQRLSLPSVATRRCSWRNNRYTRGSSTPVLSYWGQIPSNLLRPRRIGTELSHDVLNPARVPL